VCRRLMTTPDVGPVVALTYRAMTSLAAAHLAAFDPKRSCSAFQN
jgi:hypothetical protein